METWKDVRDMKTFVLFEKVFYVLFISCCSFVFSCWSLLMSQSFSIILDKLCKRIDYESLSFQFTSASLSAGAEQREEERRSSCAAEMNVCINTSESFIIYIWVERSCFCFPSPWRTEDSSINIYMHTFQSLRWCVSNSRKNLTPALLT